MTTPTYKLIIIGESGSGKTSFVHRYLDNSYNEVYTPTDGVEVTSLSIKNISFNVWDCAGDPNKKGLGEAYYIGAHCCFIFVTANTTLNTIKNYKKEIHEISPRIPIIVIINKCDDNRPNIQLASKIRQLGLHVCSISVKNDWNLFQPFTLL